VPANNSSGLILLQLFDERRLPSDDGQVARNPHRHASISLKDAPDKRAIQSPEQGSVREIEHLGGLQHEQVRLAA
jgi:hypothetical protein